MSVGLSRSLSAFVRKDTKKSPCTQSNGAGGFFVVRHFRLASRSLSPETLSVDGGILGVALDEIAARLHIVAH